MATRRQVERAAAKLGVTDLVLSPPTGAFDAWSPPGFIFAASRCHCIAHHCNVGPWTAEVYDDMLEDLRMGLEPCTAPDCDTCNPEDV